MLSRQRISRGEFTLNHEAFSDGVLTIIVTLLQDHACLG